MSSFLTHFLLWLFGIDSEGVLALERPPEFVLLHGSSLVLAAVALGALILAAICYARTTEGITTRLRIFLALVRALAIALVTFALLGGMIRFHLKKHVRQTIAIAVDASGSMNIADMNGMSRLAAAHQKINGAAGLAALSQTYEFQFFRCGNPLQSLGGMGRNTGGDSNAARLPASAVTLSFPEMSDAMGASPISDNLAEIQSRFQNDRLRAIVLLTDGRDTFNDPPSAPPSPDVPVFPVPVGKASEKDVRLTRLEAPNYTYAGDPIALAATIEHHGLADRSVTLKLLVDGKAQPESEQKITLNKTGASQVLRLSYSQKEPGLKRFQTVIVSLEEEATDRNNSQSVYLDVRPEPIRVLYIEGKPRWEYRHLKDALSTDPAVRATFLIRLTGDEWLCQGYQSLEGAPAPAATSQDGGVRPGPAQPQESAAKTEAQPAEILLKNPARGFPQDRLELMQFDVLIVGDVPRKDLEGAPMQNIYEFVKEKGGGLATLGGFSVYSAGNYETSLLNQMLPVLVLDEAEDQFEERFQALPTPAGLRHPLLQLELDPALNAKVWRELPLLEGGNILSRPRPGAFVLARHDTDFNRIIFASLKFFEGRIFSSSVDTTYLWRLGRKEEADPNYHRRFWNLAVRWLARNPQLRGQTDTLFTHANQYRVGFPIVLMTCIVDKDFNPVDNADVRFTVKSPRGHITRYAPEVSLLTPGLYQCRFSPAEVGNYQFAVNRPKPDGGEGIAQMSVFVEDDPREFQRPSVNEPGLHSLAEATGGRAVRLDDLDSLADLLKTPTADEASVVGLEVRRSWNFLLAVVALLSIEWVLRKRRGLS